ncbi:glycoside hydrolase [Mycena belliarum]|uniref:alpha-amylase n=1 Tax=Mycena belliarum TaxID=1033014 RepID=A0AAD6XSZ7_9AGAR|nr:glycoside hydrolase [Mycena belliae]
MWPSPALLPALGLPWLALALASPTPTQIQNGTAAPVGSRAPAGAKGVIVQLFEWNWDSVAAECTAFLGPAGYAFVQAVSPPQEHVAGAQWWTAYQPVSYVLASRHGDEAQFARMVSTCHAAGVRVLADTVWNHMAGGAAGTGTAGSPWAHYDYPGVYRDQDFHHCGLAPGDDIADYTSRAQVQTCQLVHLADTRDRNRPRRATLAAYGKQASRLGVDGLRLERGENVHMPASDIAAILSRLTAPGTGTGKPYVTQEVSSSAGEAVQPGEYVGNGDVQEFRYTAALRDAFSGADPGGIAGLRELEGRGWIPSALANVFVANHDTERNAVSLTPASPASTYLLATLFSLAHPYGTPTVLSSYVFSAFDEGAPDGGAGACSATGGAGAEGGWWCQHRWGAVKGMVGWRNWVGNAAMEGWVAPRADRVAFGRGARGFVAINNADAPWGAVFATALPAGGYCDVVGGASVGGTCTGAGFTVAPGGTFAATVPARGAIAIHTGQLGTGSGPGEGGGGPVAVRFEETATTVVGENVFLVGNLAQLGAWAPASAIALSAATYPVWTATVALPPNTAFEYKFIRKEADGSVIWESDPNRSATTGASGVLTITAAWK